MTTRTSPALLLLLLACKGRDQDGDGWPAAYDCDDADASVHPDAPELCDSLDQDCDDAVDEAKDLADGTTLYFDADGDGWGSPDTVVGCLGSPGTTDTPGDCDDDLFTVNPGATEICDSLDNNCDNATDGADAADATVWYADLDGDGFGGPVSEVACAAPEGYVAAGGDCNDGNESAWPGAPEQCDGIDNDCDGAIDGPTALDATEHYEDLDGDGYGDSTRPVLACAESTGIAAVGGDCDDDEPRVSPGLEEQCSDGLDNDCDGGANTCERSGDAAVEDLDAWFSGTDRSDYAGRGLAFVGDLDADGYGDLAVGAYGSNLAGTDAGVLYLIYGGASTPGGDNPLAGFPLLYGESPSDFLGRTVVSPGDLDGDGAAELLVGAKGDDDGGTSAGAAYLIYGGARLSGQRTVGGADLKLTGASSRLEAGAGLGGGDLNGDGLDELVVGAPADGASQAGYAYVLYGSATRRSGTLGLDAADVIYAGQSTGDLVGDDRTVAVVGDLDGDGRADLALGAPQYDATLGRTDAGAVYVVYGGPKTSGTVSLADADARFNGLSASDGLGVSVAGPGDADGDGYSELVMGAWQKGASNGEAYLIWGAAARLSTFGEAAPAADATFVGEDPYDYGGGALAWSDLNGDGLDDLLVGAENNGRSASAAGAAYLFYGRAFAGTLALGTDDDAAWTGSSTYDKVGSTLAGGGDVNADGYEELLIGAYWYDGGGDENAGAAFLLLGSGL